ncbi:MAG: DsbA family oxidoreductase [Flammeovirgaceae bacterium]|nr:DsbA family oxidoreductase [Flammeovirgaceae bacterium]
MKPEIKIDVVSDVVCPWCYIGKRRLEKAMESLSDKFSFKIEYLPFELNPTMPAEGKNQKTYLAEKFGGPERYDKITHHVSKIAETEGLDFNFDKQPISPNTRLMHRFIMLAKDFQKQPEVKESFMRAYFTDGVDLSKTENVVKVATSAGIPEEAAKQLIEQKELEAEVITAEREMQKLGITGVPFYIIQNKFGVSGAQPSETFEKAIEEVAAQG